MRDIPDLPLALIMEEILEWEKPKQKDSEREKEENKEMLAKT